MTDSPMKYLKPALNYGRERYEAIVFRTVTTSAHVGSDRPRWLPVRIHRGLLRLRMAAFVARAIWLDKWDYR